MAYKKSGQFSADQTTVAAALQPYGITQFVFVAATSGIENTTLIVTLPDASECVLRIYRLDKKSDADILLELAFVQELHKHGLPVPAIIPSRSGELMSRTDLDGHRWQCVLMEHIAGHHTKHYSSVLITDLARYQAQMHQLGSAWAAGQSHNDQTVGELAETEFVPLVDVSAIQSTDLRDFIARASAYRLKLPNNLPHGYSHFDYDAGNVLIGDDDHVAGILDFDDMQYGPLVICLAYSLWDVQRRNPRTTVEMESYLHAYEQVRPLIATERVSLAPIMLLRHYAIGALKVLNGSMSPAALQDFLRVEQRLMEQSATN